jgi:hypothetical protein
MDKTNGRPAKTGYSAEAMKGQTRRDSNGKTAQDRTN